MFSTTTHHVRENEWKRRFCKQPRGKRGGENFSIKQMEKQDTTFFEISAVDDKFLAIQKSWINTGHSDTI